MWLHMFGKAKGQLWVSLHKGNKLLKELQQQQQQQQQNNRVCIILELAV